MLITRNYGVGKRVPRAALEYVARTCDLIARDLRFLPAIAAGGFLLAVALVMVSAFLNDRYGAAIQENLVATGLQGQALAELIDLEDELADATSNARAFLFSADRDHLVPYAAAATASRSLLQKMETEQVDAHTGRVVQQAHSYLDSLDAIVGQVHRGERNAALAAVGPDLGRETKAVLDAEIHARRAQMTAAVAERRVAIAQELTHGRRFNSMAAFAATLVLVLFGVLLRHYFHQTQKASRALTLANETLEQRIGQRTAELAQLSQHLLTVREEERAALARDIHDQIGSEVAALRMDCARLESASTGHNPLAKSTWPRIRKTLDELTQAHRRIINSLHPTVLDHLGLQVALRELLADRASAEHIEKYLSVEGSMEDLPAEVAIAAYRVVQEALSNVLKHANARQVSILVRRDSSMLTVDISDDGVGIEPGAAEKGRLGLVGMRERAHKLGGSLEINRGPEGSGTQITARFKVDAQPMPSAERMRPSQSYQ